MDDEERTLLQSQYQTRRIRMLYLIYRKRRIENSPGIKAKLGRAFQYKSDGHLYPDLNTLKELGLIEEKSNYYYITKKGRKEFRLLETLRLTSFIMLFYGTYILLWTFFIDMDLSFTFKSPFFSIALIFFAIAILFYYTFSSYRPLSPDSSEKIE